MGWERTTFHPIQGFPLRVIVRKYFFSLCFDCFQQFSVPETSCKKDAFNFFGKEKPHRTKGKFYRTKEKSHRTKEKSHQTNEKSLRTKEKSHRTKDNARGRLMFMPDFILWCSTDILKLDSVFLGRHCLRWQWWWSWWRLGSRQKRWKRCGCLTAASEVYCTVMLLIIGRVDSESNLNALTWIKAA